MDRAFEKLIEIAKEEMIKASHGMAAANKMVPVSGTRYKLPLEGRKVEIVLYPARDDNGEVLEGTFPLIVGYHGGGFVFGGCALDDDLWVAVTSALHVAVASVGYRMSPDYRWKESLADAYDAALYLQQHAEEYGIDGTNVSVLGSSAGANLAASVTLLSNRKKELKLKNTILIYPFLDVHTDPNDKGRGSLEGPGCYAMNQMHCDYEETTDPLVSPIFASIEDLKGHPNTIINICDNDNLKHEGRKYAEMLREAGVSVHELFSSGMPHGYFESGFKTPTDFEIQTLLGEDGPRIVADGSLARSARECLDFIKENIIL